MMEHTYHLGLVGLSILVSIVASFLALGTASRIRRHNASRFVWIVGGGISMGLGIWLMHFVGMLAYHISIEIEYDIILTLLSLLLAILSSILAFYLASIKDKLSLSTEIVSAVILGLGIAGMHYVGIHAMQLEPAQQYNIVLVSISIIIALVASFYVIRFVFSASDRSGILSAENMVSAIIMGVAVSGMHYIGMEAMTIQSEAVCGVIGNGITQGSLSFIIVILVITVLVINAGILLIDLNITELNSEKAYVLAEKRKETIKIARKVTDSLAEQYKVSEEFNRKLFETVANTVMVIDRHGYVVRMNNAAEISTGYTEVELTGRLVWDILIPEDRRSDYKNILENILIGIYPNKSYFEVLSKYEGIKLFDWSYTELRDEDGTIDYIIATGDDITEKRKYEEAIRLAEIAFESNEAIFVTDNKGIILRVNNAFVEITGYSSNDACNRNPSFLKSGRHDKEFYRNMWSNLKSSGSWNGEMWNKRKNGEVYPEWLRITAVYDDNHQVRNYVATFSDITNLKAAEEKVHFFSNFESSTNLPNRKLFSELLQKDLDLTIIGELKGSVLYIELRQLDKLTDTQGIDSIDRYIKQLSILIDEKFDKDIIIGHINKTDLAILISNLNVTNVASASIEVCDFILSTIKLGVDIDDQKAFIHANIGIIDYPRENESADELLQHAITAANRSRRIQIDGYQFYSAYMHKVATENYKIEIALRDAVVNDKLQLFLQPQINDQLEIIGAEALLRWFHDGEYIPPDVFIPLAEDSNLIIEVGDWVIDKALEYVSEMNGYAMPDSFKTIAVNVSAIQIKQKDFVEKLKRKIISIGIDPSKLKIEITESAVLEKPDRVIKTIADIRELGISFAMDDFGTGYSSLSYLQKLKLDQLKIDKSFITDLSINKTSQALAETIVVMARNLGMQVIAEGVETESERSLLLQYGCKQYQGYLFSRPIEFDAFLDYAMNPIEINK